jgi:hypothetical protein
MEVIEKSELVAKRRRWIKVADEDELMEGSNLMEKIEEVEKSVQIQND